MGLVFIIPFLYLAFVKFVWSYDKLEEDVQDQFILIDDVTRTYEYTIHSFSLPLIITLKTNSSVSLFLSFCAEYPGKLVGSGQRIRLKYEPFDLYEIRNQTRCKLDKDPFYEQIDNVDKSVYLKVVGSQSEINGTIAIRSKLRREAKNLKPTVSESFELRNGSKKISRFALATDEQNAELMVSLTGYNDTVDVIVAVNRLINIIDASTVTYDSPYQKKFSVDDLLANRTSVDADGLTIIVSIYCWSSEASGTIIFLPGGSSPNDEFGTRVIINKSITDLGQDEQLTFDGQHPRDHDDWLEVRVTVIKGSFDVLAGFCDNKKVLIGNYQLGYFLERLPADRIEDIYGKTKCENALGRRKRRGSLQDYRTIHITLIGRSPLNSGYLTVLVDKAVHLKSDHTSGNSPWYVKNRVWLYIVYGIIALFALATIAFMTFFLYRFFYKHRAVSDVQAIQAYDNEHRNKIEERTSRTWI